MCLHDAEVLGMGRNFDELVERTENVLDRNLQEKNKRDIQQYGTLGLANVGGLEGKPSNVGGKGQDGNTPYCRQWQQ